MLLSYPFHQLHLLFIAKIKFICLLLNAYSIVYLRISSIAYLSITTELFQAYHPSTTQVTQDYNKNKIKLLKNKNQIRNTGKPCFNTTLTASAWQYSFRDKQKIQFIMLDDVF